MPQQIDPELDALAISRLGRSIERIIEAERARAAAHHADETEQLQAAHQEELAVLSHRLEVVTQDIARLQQNGAAEQDRHAEALRAAQERISVADAGREWATAQVAALEQARLSLVRETGCLEGQLAAHVKAEAARFADASVARAELASRLDATEQMLATSQSAVADLRMRLAVQEQAHAGKLATADAKLAVQALEIERLAREHDGAERQRAELASRLDATEQMLATSQSAVADLRMRLALQEQAHAGKFATADAKLAVQALEIARFAREQDGAERQRAELAEERDALIGKVTLLAAERDDLAGQLSAARQEAAQQLAALQKELATLRDHIAWRERQLLQAATLLATIPDPLSGLPGRLAARVRGQLGVTGLAAIADHRAAVAQWQGDTLPGDASQALPQDDLKDESSPAGNFAGAHTTSITRDVKMEDDEGPITSVPRLMAPNDRHFIRAAYQAVLGRAPDKEGEDYYLARLRAGAHKLAILGQMRRSPEGRTFIPGVSGLDRAIRRHRLATLPLLGALVRLLTREEGDSATHRRLRMLENEIGRLHRKQADLANLLHELGSTPLLVQPTPPDAGQQRETVAGDNKVEHLGVHAVRTGLAGFFLTHIWSR